MVWNMLWLNYNLYIFFNPLSWPSLICQYINSYILQITQLELAWSTIYIYMQMWVWLILHQHDLTRRSFSWTSFILFRLWFMKAVDPKNVYAHWLNRREWIKNWLKPDLHVVQSHRQNYTDDKLSPCVSFSQGYNRRWRWWSNYKWITFFNP